MIVAAFGAVYGNASALRQILDATEREGIQTLFCTGDCAMGPEPNEAIRLIQQHHVLIVQGATDRQIARFTRKRKRIERDVDESRLADLERAHHACSSANIEWLAGLPHSRTVTVDGETLVLFNGSIPSASTVLTESDPDQNFRRQREVVPARIFVCGGSDRAFIRYVDSALFANPGAVRANDTAPLRYLVVSTESGQPEAEMRSLEPESQL